MRDYKSEGVYKKNLGKTGEKITETYLIKKGYEILEKNYLKRSGEIDLIAFDPKHKEVAFVEVKTRRSHRFGQPEEAVTKAKIKKIETTALHWLKENNKLNTAWRIDIVAVQSEGREDKGGGI